MGLGKYVKSFYDKKLKATGDIIIIRKLENYHKMQYGGIYIAEISQSLGHNLCKGIVESIGPDAEFEGLTIGDQILYDHFASHGLTHPIVAVNIENVLCVIEEENLNTY